ELDTASPATAILGASLLAFYSFVGFETSANLAEEIKDVRRVYPRALFGALLAAGAVYMLVGVGAAMVLPVDQLKDS
ncbi:amino acid permease, partial [Pseudomonas syringae pv. syringae FF5]